MNKYTGHPSQLCGVEEVTLAKGRGKGMTLLEIRNGKGLRLTLSADRCMDISRLSVGEVNMGFFAPCGYAAPAFYDNCGTGFLKSFTAGFLTTCGFANAGSPCTDEGEELPLHGTVSNLPCESYSYEETETEIIVRAEVRDASLFGKKYLLHRKYICSKTENKLTIRDSVENIDTVTLPCMLLYHFNMGYPLLSEKAEVQIPSHSVKPRNEHAAEDLENCLVMEKPQRGYEERCYYHDVQARDGRASVGIFNPDAECGLVMTFGKDTLDCFTEWKMMGEGEYVLGLEPSNCTPDGRAADRKCGVLKFIAPGECYETEIELSFTKEKIKLG